MHEKFTLKIIFSNSVYTNSIEFHTNIHTRLCYNQGIQF